MTDALKGHAMNRGTLMVLKRLLVTALGALGLGALAAGTASAQGADEGNIPAPNVFDDQIACSSVVPTMPPAPGTGDAGMTALDVAITEGMAIENDTGDDDDVFDQITYVFPSTMVDCGSGTDFTADDGNAYVVAKGYADTQAAFTDLDTKENALNDAEDALEAAIDAATATDPNTDAIDDATEARDDALAARDAARRHYNALSGGPEGTNPINRLGVAEWLAVARAEGAITAYNDALTAAETTKTTLDAAVYEGYVALGQAPDADDGVGSVANDDGTVNYTELLEYISFSDQGADDSDNFNDDTGELIVPMVVDPNDPENMIPSTARESVANIRADVEAVDAAVAALEKAVAENTNPLRTDAYQLGLDRAKAEQAHIHAQWNNTLADDTDLVADVVDDPLTPDVDESDPATLGEQSIRTYQEDYNEAVSDKTEAEADLRQAVANRENATAAVIAAFTSPAAFYQQLVDLQQYEADKANNALTEAGMDATEAQQAAATAASDALIAAQGALDNYNTLQNPEDPDDPRKALVDVLLETDGDDGQALVDAIGATYEEASEAGDLAETNGERLDGLLQSETDEFGTETESGRIVDIETRIEDLFGAGEDDGMNGDDETAGIIAGIEDDIAALAAEDDPATDEDESGRVTVLEDIIHDEGGLDSRIAQNEQDIVDGDEATLTAAGDAADAGDATTLAAAKEAADAGDATTLAAAKEAADAGDATTLAAAKEAADAGDAATLAAAKEAADAGDAATLAAAKEAADAGDAATLAAAKEAADAGDAAEAKLRHEADMMLAGAIDDEAKAREDADAAEAASRHEADMMLAGAIDDEAKAREDADAAEAASRHEADMMLAGAIDDEAKAREDADAAEAASRHEADMMLAGAIDDEAKAREDADAAEAASRHEADMMLAGAIDDEVRDRTAADSMLASGIMANTDAIGAEAMARAEADTMLGGRIDTEAQARIDGDTANAANIMTNAGNIANNSMAIAAEESARMSADSMLSDRIGSNSSAITANSNRIGELSDDLDVVRSGVAASMALAGMPAINGRGISIGVGSFDGESAFAVGFQIQGEMASFKVGVTSSGGATGASAGVGFQF